MSKAPFHRRKTEVLNRYGPQVNPCRRRESNTRCSEVESSDLQLLLLLFRTMVSPGHLPGFSVPCSSGQSLTFPDYQHTQFPESAALVMDSASASPSAFWVASCLGPSSTQSQPIPAGMSWGPSCRSQRVSRPSPPSVAAPNHHMWLISSMKYIYTT